MNEETENGISFFDGKKVGKRFERQFIKEILLPDIEKQWEIDRDKPEYENTSVFEYIKSKL